MVKQETIQKDSKNNDMNNSGQKKNNEWQQTRATWRNKHPKETNCSKWTQTDKTRTHIVT